MGNLIITYQKPNYLYIAIAKYLKTNNNINNFIF